MNSGDKAKSEMFGEVFYEIFGDLAQKKIDPTVLNNKSWGLQSFGQVNASIGGPFQLIDKEEELAWKPFKRREGQHHCRGDP